MTPKDRLKALGQLVALIRDHDIARLQRLGAQRDQTRSKIETLSQPRPLPEDPTVFAAQQAHARWAANQRLHLNVVLAHETALDLEQRRKTIRSFGRAQAVARLKESKASRRD